MGFHTSKKPIRITVMNRPLPGARQHYLYMCQTKMFLCRLQGVVVVVVTVTQDSLPLCISEEFDS